MAQYTPIYSLGDRIVHRNYGIGKIESVETRPLNGVEVECFKVITENGIFWFPTDSANNPRVHPVATLELVQKAMEILQSAPRSFDIDPLKWKERIDDVQADGDFLAISRLVRDLAGLKANQKLSRTQDQALGKMIERLLKEWAASLEVDVKAVRSSFNACLKQSHTCLQNAA